MPRLPDPRARVRAGFPLLLGATGALTTLSWVRFGALGVVAPDHRYFPLAVGVPLLLLFVAVVAMAVVGLRRVVAEGAAPDLLVRRGLVLALVAAPMLPLLSNDLLSVLAYADLAWSTSTSPFTLRPGGMAASRFLPLVSETWIKAPCVYGPLQLVAWAPGLYGRTPLLAVLLEKIPALAMGLAVLGLGHRYARRRPQCWPAFALLALHPVLWIEGVGQAHTDLLTAVCIAGWMVAAGAGAALVAGALLGLAIASKLTALVPAGMYLVFLLSRRERPLPARIATCAGAGTAMLLSAALCWWPFWVGPDTLRRPLWFLSWKWPVNTWSEVLFRAWDTLDLPLWVATRAVNDVASALTLLLAVGGIVAAWRAVSFGQLVERAAIVSLLALTTVASTFQPWYVLPCLVMGLEVRHPVWQRFLMVTATVALVLDGSCLLDQPGMVHEAWRLITLPLACILWTVDLTPRVRALWSDADSALAAADQAGSERSALEAITA